MTHTLDTRIALILMADRVGDLRANAPDSLRGFLTHGTHLEWDINLEDRTPISGEAYTAFAHHRFFSAISTGSEGSFGQ